MSYDKLSTKPYSTIRSTSKLQGPVVVAFGSIAARHGVEVGLATVIHLSIPVGLGMVVQYTVQALLGVPSLDAEHHALRGV